MLSIVKTDKVTNGVSRMIFGNEDNTYFRSKGEFGATELMKGNYKEVWITKMGEKLFFF